MKMTLTSKRCAMTVVTVEEKKIYVRLRTPDREDSWSAFGCTGVWLGP